MKRPARYPPRPNSEAGLTLIESLLAVIVVAILVVAIGPVIALSAATRIQARRVEWGAQAARSYLDGIRAGTITPPPIFEYDPSGADATAKLQDTIAELNNVTAPPSGTLNCDPASPPSGYGSGYCGNPAPTSNYALYCIDGNGNGQCTANDIKDFVVQASGVRRPPAAGTLTQTQRAERGYLMSIRVYRADGFQGSEAFLKSDSGTRRRDNTAASGLGKRKAPILETILEVTPDSATFSDIEQRLEP